MNEISPRPWKVTFFDFDEKNQNAMYAIKCLNEYDGLIEEVERLKGIIWGLVKSLKSAKDTTEYPDYAREWRKIIEEAEDILK